MRLLFSLAVLLGWLIFLSPVVSLQLGTSALFTDQAALDGNTFSTAASFSTCTAGGTGLLDASSEARGSGGLRGGFEGDPELAFTNGSGEADNQRDDGDNHLYYGYGISIPADCSVAGIELRIDWWLSGTSGINSMSVELSWNAGSSWTAAKTDSVETTSEHTTTLGGATDTWGHTWTVSETGTRISV